MKLFFRLQNYETTGLLPLLKTTKKSPSSCHFLPKCPMLEPQSAFCGQKRQKSTLISILLFIFVSSWGTLRPFQPKTYHHEKDSYPSGLLACSIHLTSPDQSRQTQEHPPTLCPGQGQSGPERQDSPQQAPATRAEQPVRRGPSLQGLIFIHNFISY